MKWTRNKPGAVGYYWYRDDEDAKPYVFEVMRDLHELMIYSVEGKCFFGLDDYDGWFSDEPIGLPEEK